jgi:serine/threonine protein kinase HipA of HipAB toxin-antitoxin module
MSRLCIFNLAGGLYQLTPLYDMISVHPLVEAQQITIAMAVHGKKIRHMWVGSL